MSEDDPAVQYRQLGTTLFGVSLPLIESVFQAPTYGLREFTKGRSSMRLSISTTVLLIFFVVSLSAQSSRVSANDGDIVVTPIVHASVQVEYGDMVIHVDPWSAGNLTQAKRADLILVTDDPGHHLDPVAIEQLRSVGGRFSLDD